MQLYLTNETIGGEELVTEHDAWFNADFSRLNFAEVARKMVEVKGKELIMHDCSDQDTW